MDGLDGTISAMASRLAAGEVSVHMLVADCLVRMTAHDPIVHAMLAIDPTAIEQARACDADRAAGISRGPLHGIPLVAVG